MKNYDTVIFDLDGTLLNTLEDLADGVNHVMEENGYPKRTLEEVRLFVGNGIRRLMEQAVPESVTGDEFERVFEEFRSYYTEHCQIKTRAYDGIMQLLDTLKKQGYAMAIVSNKNHAAVCELNEIYFKEYIKVAIGQKDGIRKKPAPDTVIQALKKLGKEKETAIYVGDSEVDFATAKNSGMDCALVTWGFRTKNELAEFEPTVFIDQPEELLAVLEKV
ncbi:MAG: HAD-IA family hydrolase [Lachnospiraceae bacterium]|nr:HAD-IA family hydrolase [Lachnospiraceae bacterium]